MKMPPCISLLAKDYRTMTSGWTRGTVVPEVLPGMLVQNRRFRQIIFIKLGGGYRRTVPRRDLRTVAFMVGVMPRKNATRKLQAATGTEDSLARTSPTQ